MEYLNRIAANAAALPTVDALRNSEGASMTYAQLWQASESLAALIDGYDVPRQQPIMVYGHKNPLMVAAFHACLKTGHPYVPCDMFSVPVERVGNIIAQISQVTGEAQPLVLATEEFPAIETPARVVDAEHLAAAATEDAPASDPARYVAGEDLAYILFTSGSTGTPKGVMVTADCFDNFCRWALTITDVPREGAVFLNQAPFSFDLSVYELAQALWAGGTLYSMTHATQASMRDQFAALADCGVSIWVSTPSFADMCMVEKTFDQDMLPDLRLFLFCGETLTNNTAARLRERFPQAIVTNTYGPTESTVAITSVVVTPAMEQAAEPLSCGAPRPGTRIRVIDAEGSTLPQGQMGEIVIDGDTVARGYFGRDDLTAKAFGTVDMDGRTVRCYRTGDEGWLDEDGQLRFRGRLDLQIKLNGFRMELGDIEEHFQKLEGVEACAVVPARKEGRITHLVAHVVYSGPRDQSDFRIGLALKEQLKAELPHYMIPKKVVLTDRLPMTPNGKLDRKALQNM